MSEREELERAMAALDGQRTALISWGLWVEGSARRCAGDWKEAMAALRRARELAENTRDYLIFQAARHELGQCYLRQGLLNEALAEQEELKKYHREHPTKSTVMLPLYNGLAEAYLSAAESQPQKAEWLKRAGLACQDVLRHGKVFRTQMPDALRLQGRYEWLRGKPEAARQLWNKSLAEAERMGMRYDEGMTHLELGQRLGERAHLQKAETIFTEIGAKLDLARTKELQEGGGGE